MKEKKQWLWVILMFIGMTFLSGLCTAEEMESKSIELSINGYTVLIDPYLQGNWIEPMSMRGDGVNDFTFGEYAGWKITLNGLSTTSGANAELVLPSQVLRKNEGVELKFTNEKTGKAYTQYVRCLNQGFPTLIIKANDVQPGYYYTNLELEWLTKLDTEGNVIFYKYGEGSQMGYFYPCELSDQRLFYVYLTGYTDLDHFYPVVGASRNYDKAVILDKDYRPVREIKKISSAGGEDPIPLDCHEIIMLAEDHFLLLSYVPTYADNVPTELMGSRAGYPARVLANVIQEIKNGELVFQWKSTDYPEFYAMSVEGNTYDNSDADFCDYMHCNSMTICPNDGNIVASFRHLDAIIEIDRKTGQTNWILGGKCDMFGLSKNEQFIRQHYARFTDDGTMTLFDNQCNLGEAPGNGMPRALEFRLDEEKHKVISFQSFDYSLLCGDIMGSAQKTGKDIFVMGWGFSFKHRADVSFSEIDFKNKKVLFECVDDSGADCTYRVFKFDR